MYVCGVPNLLGLNLSNLINTKIKKSCSLYSNVFYIDSIKSKVIYKVNNKFIFDIHYDEIEYLQFNIVILKNIILNFNKRHLFIEFDKLLKKFNYYEYNDIENYCFEEIYELLDNNKNIINDELIYDLIKYYKSRYSYDYFYTPKEYIEALLLKNINTLLDK